MSKLIDFDSSLVNANNFKSSRRSNGVDRWPTLSPLCGEKMDDLRSKVIDFYNFKVADESILPNDPNTINISITRSRIAKDSYFGVIINLMDVLINLYKYLLSRNSTYF